MDEDDENEIKRENIQTTDEFAEEVIPDDEQLTREEVLEGFIINLMNFN